MDRLGEAYDSSVKVSWLRLLLTDKLGEAYDSSAKVNWLPLLLPLVEISYVLLMKSFLLIFFLFKWSWHYNYVRPLGSTTEVVDLTKMQLANFLRVWNYFYMKAYHLGMIFYRLVVCALRSFLRELLCWQSVSWLYLLFLLLGSPLVLGQESTIGLNGENFRKSSQSRPSMFCCNCYCKNRELMPRAHVAFGKVCLRTLDFMYLSHWHSHVLLCSLALHSQVARSWISDKKVWKRARDYLGLISETAICLLVLGPSQPSDGDV